MSVSLVLALQRPFKSNLGIPSGHPHNLFNLNRFHRFVKGVLVLVSELLLLMPVMILYLGSMTKVQSAVLVALFGTIFSFTIALVPGSTFYERLVALSAFMAVLVTFLAQLETGGPAAN